MLVGALAQIDHCCVEARRDGLLCMVLYRQDVLEVEIDPGLASITQPLLDLGYTRHRILILLVENAHPWPSTNWAQSLMNLRQAHRMASVAYFV